MKHHVIIHVRILGIVAVLTDDNGLKAVQGPLFHIQRLRLNEKISFLTSAECKNERDCSIELFKSNIRQGDYYLKGCSQQDQGEDFCCKEE